MVGVVIVWLSSFAAVELFSLLLLQFVSSYTFGFVLFS